MADILHIWQPQLLNELLAQHVAASEVKKVRRECAFVASAPVCVCGWSGNECCGPEVTLKCVYSKECVEGCWPGT